MDDCTHLPRKRKADADDCPCAPDSSTRAPSDAAPAPDPTFLPQAATPRMPDSVDLPAASSWNRPRHNTVPLLQWHPPSIATTHPFLPPIQGPSRPKRPRIEIPSSPRKVRRARTPFTALVPARMSRHARLGELRDTGVVSATEPRPSRTTYLSAGHLSPPHRPAHSAPSSPTIEPVSPHVPSHQPPINRETLKELDLEAILRNPQLREYFTLSRLSFFVEPVIPPGHDLLFDSGLQFRPTSSRRKRDLADNYWSAIVRELENGCTCATVDAHGRPLERVCICKSVPMPVGRSIRASTPAGTFVTVRTPSRLKPLLTELLEVLISIIQPVVPGLLGLHPGLLHPQYNQNAAHVALLRAMLDADLIQQEIDHGLFDPCGVFQTIGDIVRCYCAPMRDHAVDQMVQLAQSCSPGGEGTKADAVRAIRVCFEIMELMKLDVANHQLQTLRPYLVHSAAQFELKTFQESRQKGSLSSSSSLASSSSSPSNSPLPFSLTITREWLKSAYAQTPSPSIAVSRTVSGPKPSRHAQIQATLTRALVSLIFDPPSSVCTPLSSPSTTMTGKGEGKTERGYPETLYLDHARLGVLSRDAADFTALYMLMMLHRQLLHSGSTTSTGSSSSAKEKAKGQTRTVVVKPEELLTLKKDVWEIGPAHFGLCFRQGEFGCGGEEREREREWEKWRDEIGNAVLHLTVHATDARSASSPPSENGNALPTRTPDAGLLNLATNWVRSHLRKDSALSGLMRTRLRKKVEEVALGLVLPSPSPSSSSPSSTSTPSSTSSLSLSLKKPSPASEPAPSANVASSGLEPLMPEITHLAERLVKLVGIHMNVYGALYTQPGFTFLATLFVLIGVSCAIVLRSFYLRRQMRRRYAEAVLAGFIPPSPAMPGERRRKRKNEFGEKPRLFDVVVVPARAEGEGGGEGGGEEWEELLPVSAKAKIPKPRSIPAEPDPPPTRISAFKNTIAHTVNRIPNPLHRRPPSPPPQPLDDPNSNPDPDPPQDPLAVANDVQVSVLIAMPHPHGSGMSDWASMKGKGRAESGVWEDEQEGVPDVVIGVSQVVLKRDYTQS
ncbi:hypothetical protein EIP91_002575 [Steccherinum ochraceum]|uniref:Tcp11-domain-containing protein n=1 Tax=Steccherinum ochraceum TaxID=92696 RepID=A0A4R0RBZ6_9APHY|nr:hypothetical protein EIP91_002575 [Steccherinum ochraceum]